MNSRTSISFMVAIAAVALYIERLLKGVALHYVQSVRGRTAVKLTRKPNSQLEIFSIVNNQITISL